MNSTVVVIPSYPQEESSGQILANEMEDEEMENEDTQIIEINPKSIEQLCRTCLCKLDLIPIDTSTISSGEKLSFLLELCLSLKVDPSDPLPKNICANCVNEIQRFYYFRKQCHLNESTLKLILTSSAADSDDDSPNDDKYDLNTREEEEGDSGCRDSRLDETATVIFNKDTKEWDHNYGKQIFKNETEMSENSDDEVVEKLIIRNDSNDENEDNDDTVKEETTLNDVKQVKEYFSCNGCDDLFASRGEMQRHKREANHSKESSSYMCEICSKIVTSRFKLNAHLRSHTKEKPYKCNMCSSMFSLAGNLMRHMKTHTGEKPHICEFCGKGFAQKKNLLFHIKTDHQIRNERSLNSNEKQLPGLPEKDDDNDKIYDCFICGKIFKTQQRYHMHMEKHDPEHKEKYEKPTEPLLYCDVCGKGFSNKYKLKSHKQIHGEKTFVCSDCGRAFYKKTTFDAHLKAMHLDNKIYKCENCPKVFTNMSALSFHRVTHTGYKSHRCEICSKMFTQSAGLRSHLRIHTGETPYACKVCPKRFKQQSQLMYHKRIHSGEKPYMCPYCGKAFALNGNLTVHIRTHTGETPYVCPVCMKGFYDASSRKKHCVTQHGISLKTGDFPTSSGSFEKDAESNDNFTAYCAEEVKQENSQSSMTYLIQRPQKDDDDDDDADDDGVGEFLLKNSTNRMAYIIQEAEDEDSQNSMTYIIEPSNRNSLQSIF